MRPDGRGPRPTAAVFAFVALAAAGLTRALAGCADPAPSIDDATCPPGGTRLDWASFGRPFVTAHCASCHGGGHAHSSRSFTAVEHVRADRARIYAVATGENPSMPPGPDDPPDDARAALAEWLACGAP